MDTIYKKISLERFKSRLPGIINGVSTVWRIPSLSDDVYYTFAEARRNADLSNMSYDEIKSYREFLNFSEKDLISGNTIGNYGLVVSDIEIPSSFNDVIDDYTDLYVNIPTNNESGETYYTIYDLTWKNINENAVYGEPFYYYYDRNIYSYDSWDGYDEDATLDTIGQGGSIHKYLTYSSLNKWCKFFQDYENLLRSGKSSHSYKNAMEYYKYEEKKKKDSKEKVYQTIDNIYESRGGSAFWEWIKSNCIPKYYIPSKLISAWNTYYLFYPTAIKWAGWFGNRYNLYSGFTSPSECSNAEDCCDCSEYFRLGGNEFYSGLTTWIDSISFENASTNSASIVIPILLHSNIDDIGEMTIFSSDWDAGVNYGSTLPKVNTQNGLSGGTVVHNPVVTDEEGNVFVNYESYMIKDGNSTGYYQNQYKENVFNVNDWVQYSDVYMQRHPYEFVSKISGYSFNTDGVVVYNPTDDLMCTEYNVISSNFGYILMKGELYEIEPVKYVSYSGLSNSLINGKTFVVKQTAEGLYYTTVNGRKYFAIEKDGEYYFNFMKNTRCATYNDYTSPIIPYGKNDYAHCVFINGGMHLLSTNDELVISEQMTETHTIVHHYPKIDGYVDIDSERYYISADTYLCVSDYSESVEDTENDITHVYYKFKIDDRKWKKSAVYPKITTEVVNVDLGGSNDTVEIPKSVKVLYPYNVFKCGVISGYTDSKLDSLTTKRTFTDDAGNVMPGDFRVSNNASDEEMFYAENMMNEDYRLNSNVPYPYVDQMLELYYKVGTVSNLSRNEKLSDPSRIDRQYFNGNILQRMRFYYKNGNSAFTETAIEIDNDLGVYSFNDDEIRDYSETSGITIDETMKAIEKCIELTNEYKEQNNEKIDTEEYVNLKLSDCIYCDFTYYLGAILRQRVSGGVVEGYSYNGYELADGLHHGVQYFETYKLKEEQTQFYLFSGSNYSVRYYNLIACDKRFIRANAYNNVLRIINNAKFSMKINTMKIDDDGNVVPVNSEYKSENGFSPTNGVINAPVFKQEFLLGVSTPQKVNADIYIDRGRHRAIDKHLRLQEINTFEALLQYNNGSIFNIIDNG